MAVPFDPGYFSFEFVFALRDDEVQDQKCSPPVAVGSLRPVFVRNVRPRGGLPDILGGLTSEQLEERGPPETIIAAGVLRLQAAVVEESAQRWKSAMNEDADRVLAAFFKAADGADVDTDADVAEAPRMARRRGGSVWRDEEVELKDPDLHEIRNARYSCSYDPVAQAMVFRYVIIHKELDMMTMW